MTQRSSSFLMVALLLCSGLLAMAAPPVQASSDAGRTSHTTVVQFGSGFDETIIATSVADDLSTPRDIAFNPGVADELWVLNRGDDSMTIVHNAGKTNQWSDNRQDAYGNHFMEEASAMAFGQAHSEFGTIFATAQETRNTYDGASAPNNFMGPALWPGSLSHFAAENQNGGGLGSHLDMLHESPNGMGIAHDSGNAYWYFDGYYSELVYYDFHEDHDTGGEDHDDGVVRRYSEISLTRRANVPGHMMLDKSNGILYIADTGTNRVLWVNTDDPSTTTTNIYNSPSHPPRGGNEALAEYSSITNVEWGVLATGLSRPSGLVVYGDTLFISQNSNGKISAYDLASNGKSAALIQTVDTSANSIMGLDIGPGGKLWYVDAGLARVIRLDVFPDGDGDGIRDSLDNCPDVANTDQNDHDGDALGDFCDPDGDGDGVLNDDEGDCGYGEIGWTSTPSTDYDGDGCRDSTEDVDDDSDGLQDGDDDCEKGELGWTSDPTTDYDNDGCRDSTEDDDDDNDLICDVGGPGTRCNAGWPNLDRCPLGRIGFRSAPLTDQDRDGCEDALEDLNDDDDAYPDAEDLCPTTYGEANQGVQVGCPDLDEDGWADVEDDFFSDPTQWRDTDQDGYGDQSDGNRPDGCTTIPGESTEDRFGCPDSDEDGYSNPDPDWSTTQGGDAFISDASQWADRDGDGFGDEAEGFQADVCPDTPGTSVTDRYGCVDSDSDGWSDAGDAFPGEPSQWADGDYDGYGDEAGGVNADDCPADWGTSTLGLLGCVDGDGDHWADFVDIYPNDQRLWSDEDGDTYADQPETNLSDDCLGEWGNSTVDRLGCLDSDGDGVSDEADFYPLDASRSAEEVEESSMVMTIAVIGLIVMLGLVALLGVMVIRKRGGPGAVASPMLLDELPPLTMPAPMPELQPAPAEVPQGPPIPAEGIPAGWTIEQWTHYGEGWLRDNGRL
jgi:hypothetical protein